MVAIVVVPQLSEDCSKDDIHTTYGDVTPSGSVASGYVQRASRARLVQAMAVAGPGFTASAPLRSHHVPSSQSMSSSPLA
jgi:hypothetical protein